MARDAVLSNYYLHITPDCLAGHHWYYSYCFHLRKMEDTVSEKSQGLHGGSNASDGLNDKNDAPLNDVATTDPKINKRITRKFDKHVVPWLFGIWLLAFLDRANIGNAKIDGLAKDTEAHWHRVQCCARNLLRALHLRRRP